MTNFPTSSLIPENVPKASLARDLKAAGLGSIAIGLKKPLQVRLTLERLGLQQVDERMEDQLVTWFSFQQPQLLALCQDRNVQTGTIADMRRVLVWDLAEQGKIEKKLPKEKNYCPGINYSRVIRTRSTHA